MGKLLWGLFLIPFVSEAIGDVRHYVSGFSTLTLKDGSQVSGWLKVDSLPPQRELNGKLEGKTWKLPLRFFRKFQVNFPEGLSKVTYADRSSTTLLLEEKRSDCRKPKNTLVSLMKIKSLEIDFVAKAPVRPEGECLGEGGAAGDGSWLTIAGSAKDPQTQKKLNAVKLYNFALTQEGDFPDDLNQYPEGLKNWAKKLMKNTDSLDQVKDWAPLEKLGIWTESSHDYYSEIPFSHKTESERLFRDIASDCEKSGDSKSCAETEFVTLSFFQEVKRRVPDYYERVLGTIKVPSHLPSSFIQSAKHFEEEQAKQIPLRNALEAAVAECRKTAIASAPPTQRSKTRDEILRFKNECINRKSPDEADDLPPAANKSMRHAFCNKEVSKKMSQLSLNEEKDSATHRALVDSVTNKCLPQNLKLPLPKSDLEIATEIAKQNPEYGKKAEELKSDFRYILTSIKEAPARYASDFKRERRVFDYFNFWSAKKCISNASSFCKELTPYIESYKVAPTYQKNWDFSYNAWPEN